LGFRTSLDAKPVLKKEDNSDYLILSSALDNVFIYSFQYGVKLIY